MKANNTLKKLTSLAVITSGLFLGGSALAQVKGNDVTQVSFANGLSFTHVDGRVWHELDKNGKKASTFEQQSKDEWSVYLRDGSRGVNIHLDLWTKKVNYSDSQGNKFVYASIEEAFNKAALPVKICGDFHFQNVGLSSDGAHLVSNNFEIGAMVPITSQSRTVINGLESSGETLYGCAYSDELPANGFEGLALNTKFIDFSAKKTR